MGSKNLMRAILVGTAVGEALGVPVEFQPREYMLIHPITTMEGGGTNGEVAGTWSEGTSLSLCLADALLDGYNLATIARKFILWKDSKIWTAHGTIFAIGNTVAEAIDRLKEGENPEKAGSKNEYDNSNRVLMRILPLLPFIKNMSYDERIPKIVQVSSITNRNPRSLLGCIILMEFARNLISHNFKDAFSLMQHEINSTMPYADEEDSYKRILKLPVNMFINIAESDILSSGYVVDSLETAVWCLLNSKSYREAVLKAVNLGGDTATIGAITGGLAGIAYSYNEIPKIWKDKLANKEVINRLCNRWEEESL